MLNQNTTKLTQEILRDKGFICQRESDKENDLDGLWHRDGITLYQDFWLDEDFSFATRTRENGEFKSGFGIETLEQLEKLFEGLGQKL